MKRHPFAVVAGSLLAALALAPLQAQSPAAGLLSIPDPVALDKQIDLDGGKHLKDMKTIIIPTVLLRVSARGSLTVVNQGRFFETDGNTAKATAKFVVAGLDKAYIQDLARQLQNDLVARLRNAGFTVLTWDDIKANPEVVAMKRYKADAPYEVPTGGPTGSKNTYLMAFPSDEQAIDPPFQGYAWGFRKVAKDLDAGIMVPEYLVEAPLLTGAKKHGVSTRGVTVSVFPEMTVSAFMPFNTAKGAWGSLRLKSAIGDLADSVGTLGEAKDNSPEFANALSKGLAQLSGVGAISSKVNVWGMLVNRDAYATALRRGVVSVHIAAEKAITAERQK
jgi:hypothetical protein